MEKDFLIGAASAGHQVEGNNTNSDIWVLENMKYGGYPEKSGAACDHYNRYRKDIRLMAEAGLNAYRFSLEWSRIEPECGRFDENEMKHYLDVIDCCRENGIEPIVTLHHFSSPKWVIEKGGWESEDVITFFGNYTEYVCLALKDRNLRYLATLNEANMGNLISIFIRQAMMERARREGEKAAVQIGLDIDNMSKQEEEKRAENRAVFGVDEPAVFVSPRTENGNRIIMEAHKNAVRIIHNMLPGVKTGLTLSLRDVQCVPGGEENAKKDWYEEFEQFLPAIKEDDFLGVQNYTRTVFDADGEMSPPKDAELTQMGYEFYPQGLGNVLRKVAKEFPGDILITENGIATDEDSRRVAFINEAIQQVRLCIDDNIPVKGYMYWSLMDNFEWQSGYAMQFGLMGIDRKTMERQPRESLTYLGKITF